MIEINEDPIPEEIKKYFDLTDPAGLRCAGVLDGILPGRIFADSISNPSWFVLQETTFGSIYLGGDIESECLSVVIQRLLKDGDVLLGMWSEDERWGIVPLEADYDGEVLDFYDRPVGTGLEDFRHSIPEGCEIRLVDPSLLDRSIYREQHIRDFGCLENAMQKLFGYYLMRGEEILCEALSGPLIRGFREPGVETYEGHRQKGYATITCAFQIHAIEAAGYQTFWNCNSTNLASVALARKLGYRKEMRYHLRAWFCKKC